MSDDNPYRSPQYLGPTADLPPVAAGGSVWREGRLLVIRKGAVLPDRCVKTNEPALGIRAKQTYQWYPPRMWLAVVRAPLFGAILLTPKYRQEAVVEMPLSRKRLVRRRRWQWIGWALVLAGLGLNPLGVSMFEFESIQESNGAMACAAIGVAILLTGLFAVLLTPTVRLRAKRMQGDFVWFKGVHPDYLADLPEWPGA